MSRADHRAASAESVATSLLDRCHALRALHALSWQSPARVIDAAQRVDRAVAKGEPVGPLAGMPIVVKDNIDTIGYATSAGHALLRDDMPTHDAPVWRALADAGAVLIGKANMHELAAGATSRNATFGNVANPVTPERIPGGSSGGTAAAIAAGLAVAGLGTDTSGSLRTPAAFCGIVALRPSTGRHRAYALDGIVPLVPAFDTAGPMARTVDDLILLHEAITRRPVKPMAHAAPLKTIRIGIPRGWLWDDLEPAVEAACRDALERWRSAGATLVDMAPRDLVGQAIACQVAVGGLRRRPALGAWLAERLPHTSLEAFVDAIQGGDVRALYLADALAEAETEAARDAGDPPHLRSCSDALLQELAALGERHRAWMDAQALDVIAYPTAPVTAPQVADARGEPDDTVAHNGRRVPLGAIVSRNARFAAALGLPAVSLPVAGAGANGPPIGMELSARPGDDEALLAVTRSLATVLAGTPVGEPRAAAC